MTKVNVEMSCKKFAAVALYDLSKAFDCVNLDILLRNTLNWFKSHLSGRKQ